MGWDGMVWDPKKRITFTNIKFSNQKINLPTE